MPPEEAPKGTSEDFVAMAPRSVVVLKVSPAGKNLRVHLEGVAHRDAASAYTHHRVLVPEAELPPPEDGEFFIEALIGEEAKRPDGTFLGTIEGTLWNGAHDVLTIVTPEGRQVLVPAVSDFVCSSEPGNVVIDPHGMDEA